MIAVTKIYPFADKHVNGCRLCFITSGRSVPTFHVNLLTGLLMATLY